MGAKSSTWRLDASGTVAYTGTRGVSTAAAAGITAVRVLTTTAAYIKIGKDAEAVANDTYMPAGVAEIFQCGAGERVSAIQVASGGNLQWTFLTHG
jgi:hypothetical protein